MELMELHEIIYEIGDRIVIIGDPEVKDGTKGIVKKTGFTSATGKDLICVVRFDNGGWTDKEDGTPHCWNVFPSEIALDPDAEEFEEDQ